MEHLEEKGFVTKTPEFVLRSQPRHQLTTEQANRSRLVTKTRFVVEAEHAQLKVVWPIFADIWSTRSVNHLRADLRIAAALLNKFFNRIVADKGKEVQVATAMLAKLNTRNYLNEILAGYTSQELGEFQLIEDATFQFPRIKKGELDQITLGSYQLKQARSYAHAHKKAKMERFGVPFPCFVCADDITRRIFAGMIAERNITSPVLAYTRMNSRFISKKIVDVFVLADATKNGPDGIIGYCCECQHGLRTIGCCSHVATVIYYLCYAKHHGGIISVAGHVGDFFEVIAIENELEDEEE